MGSLGAAGRTFDFEKLAEVTRTITDNLNKASVCDFIVCMFLFV